MYSKELKEIATLIKHNKIVFDYGVNTSDDYTKSIAYINSNGIIDKGGAAPYGDDTVVGYAKIGNLFVIQEVEYDKLPIIAYIVYNSDLKFKKLKSISLNSLKIFGALRSWQQEKNIPPDKDLYLIKHLGVPKESKQCEKPLFRSLTLSPIALKRLKKGKSITLQNRKFSSWSEEYNAVINFGSDNSFLHTIIQYSPKPNEILINILAFLSLFGDHYNSITEDHEHEVICINSPKMLIIHPNQVVNLHDKRTIYHEDETEVEPLNTIISNFKK